MRSVFDIKRRFKRTQIRAKPSQAIQRNSKPRQANQRGRTAIQAKQSKGKLK